MVDVAGGSTAPRSHTAGRCAGWFAGRGPPRSEQEHGSETTTASVSLSQGAPFSWPGLCELPGAQRGE